MWNLELQIIRTLCDVELSNYELKALCASLLPSGGEAGKGLLYHFSFFI